MALPGSAQKANALSFLQNTLEFSITLISAFSLLTKVDTKVDRVYSINLGRYSINLAIGENNDVTCSRS